MLPLLPASSYVPLFYLSASPLSLCAVRLLGCLSCSLLPACMYLYLPACIAYGCFSSLYCFVCTGYPYVSLLMYATCCSGIPCVNLSLSSVVMLVWYGLLSVWLACTWGAMWFYGYLYVAISLYGGFYGWRISGVLYASVWVSTVSLGYALSSLCGAGYALLSCMWLYVSGVLCLLAIRWGGSLFFCVATGAYFLCAICWCGFVAALVGYLVILGVADMQRMLLIVSGGGGHLLAYSVCGALLGGCSNCYDSDCWAEVSF